MNDLPASEKIPREQNISEETCEHIFFQAYNRYQTYSYQISYDITRSKPISEDISQEVFLTLWSHKEQLSAIKNLKAFVGITARNLSIDYLRRQTLAHHVMEEYTNAKNNYLNLDEYFDRKETERLLQMAIQALTPHRRAVFVLGWMEGLSREQISSRLGISLNTVKSLMQKARHDIRLYFTKHTGLRKTNILKTMKHIWHPDKTSKVA